MLVTRVASARQPESPHAVRREGVLARSGSAALRSIGNGRRERQPPGYEFTVLGGSKGSSSAAHRISTPKQEGAYWRMYSEPILARPASGPGSGWQVTRRQ
jgi:hypothetical protein